VKAVKTQMRARIIIEQNKRVVTGRVMAQNPIAGTALSGIVKNEGMDWCKFDHTFNLNDRLYILGGLVASKASC
jgi:hypothetical protein